MATIRKHCKSYKIQSNTSPNTQAGNADIVCYDGGGNNLGSLHFDENGFQQGSGGYINNGRMEMFFHFRSLASVIDILRNEGPCDLVIDTVSHLGYVTSGIERVGEGETP